MSIKMKAKFRGAMVDQVRDPQHGWTDIVACSLSETLKKRAWHDADMFRIVGKGDYMRTEIVEPVKKQAEVMG